MSGFKKASRKRVYLKIGVTGPSGAGKSYSSLKLAEGLANGGTIAAIDTENGSMSLYDNLTDFDVLDLSPPFEPKKYIQAIRDAENAGYTVLIVDSFSHAWKYLLSKKEDLDRRGGQGQNNKFANWGPVKAEADELKDAILQSKLHVICCMRSKTEYEQSGGKVTKLGTAAVQEPDVEYEFTTVFDVDMAHKAMTSKDRTGCFGGDAFKIGVNTGQVFLKWLDSASSQEYAIPPAHAPQTPNTPSQTVSDADKAAGNYLKICKLTREEFQEFKDYCEKERTLWTAAAIDAKTVGCVNFVQIMRLVKEGVLPNGSVRG